MDWRAPLRKLRRRWRPDRAAGAPPAADAGVRSSLRELLDDPQIPAPLRAEMAAEFTALEARLARLEAGELHVALFGRVSVGKSALGNALLGREAFPTGVVHGTTTAAAAQPLGRAGGVGLQLIDTPGINELEGEARERLAFEVAEISDLVVFVADGDLTRDEVDALEALRGTHRPLLLVLNKADRYAADEQARLLEHLRRRAAGIVQPENVVAVAAHPPPLREVHVGADGREQLRELPRAPQVAALRTRLDAIAASEGKDLAAIHAGVAAGELSDRVSQRMATARRCLARKLIRQYCLAKGVAVALNPVPVADLLAAAGLDAAMTVQLSRLYGLPLTRSESGRLVATISAQLVALMGAVWGVNLVSSALKGVSGGMSTVLTAAVQGALAWYATTVVGTAVETWLVQGKSWGEKGAKRAVREVLEGLDRDSILREARSEILRHLRAR